MTRPTTSAAPGADRSRPPLPGALRPFHFPPIERAALSNGLPLLFAPSAGFSVATVSILLPAGGVYEPRERAGLASLTSSLLESGAGSRDAAEIADELEELGLQLGTGSGWDSAHVEMTGLCSRIPAGLAILSDLVRRPSFPEAEVERLRHEHLAAIVQRRAEPRGLANEMAARFVFAGESPFSRPLGGTAKSVRELTRSDVASFHASQFSPFGATLIVTGDLDADEAVELAEGAFGSWVGPATSVAPVPAESRFDATRVVLVDRPGSVQSEIRVGRVGVPRSAADYFPILVMNAILGGAFSSRLNLNLRERHGFTYGVTSTFVMRRQPGPFLVSTAVQTEVTAPAVTEIFREMRAIREAPVTAAELDDARNYLAGIFPLRLQTTEGVASRLAELALYDLPPDYFDRYRERILAVSADEVRESALRHVLPDEMAVVIVGDAEKIREPIEALGLGPVEVVDAGASDS